MPKPFELEEIPGVFIRPVTLHSDQRGLSAELFREDDPENFKMRHAMGYVSFTHPKEKRGPHEHLYQTDCFVFCDGYYEIHLWDNRVKFPLETHKVIKGGYDTPIKIIIPPNVVHGYENVGSQESCVLNFPDRLYKGWAKKQEVDEIRHEDIHSIFKI